MELRRGVQAPSVAIAALQNRRRGHPEGLCPWSPLTHSPLRPLWLLSPRLSLPARPSRSCLRTLGGWNSTTASHGPRSAPP